MLDEWESVDNDLADLYGLDTTTAGLRSVTWPWLRSKIHGLLSCPPAAYIRVPGKGPDPRKEYARLDPVWRTRVQTALMTKGA